MTHLTSRTLILSLTAALTLLAAQAKPNFSGEWKVNTSKSNFGPLPPPAGMSETIAHQQESVKIALVTTTGDGEMVVALQYTTDGKESVNQVGAAKMRTVGEWVGDTLVLKSKADFGQGELTIVERWDLSEDGKVLTARVHLSGSQGDADQNLRFEKQ